MESFISIPPSLKPSNAPTPDNRRADNSPQPSGGAGTPNPLHGLTQGSIAPGSTNASADDSEEELRRNENAVEALQQMDLWSLVLDLMTRVQEGSVTAKSVDNEAGIIRARISKARGSLKQVSGLDVSIGERKEEIARLQEAIQKKRDLLLRFQAVMGATSKSTEPLSFGQKKNIASQQENAPTIIFTEASQFKETGDDSSSSVKPKEESVDPITDVIDARGGNMMDFESTASNLLGGDSKPDDANTDLDSFMSGLGQDVGASVNTSQADVDLGFNPGDFMTADPGVVSGETQPQQQTQTEQQPQQQGDNDLLYDLQLDNFDGFNF